MESVMRLIRFLTTTTVFLVPLSSMAANSLKLICAYKFTVVANGHRSPTTGEKLFSVAPTSNGRAVINKEGLSAAFAGRISDDAIQGQTEYQLQDITIKETLEINRFTGAFTNTFGNKSDAGLVHFGTCRPVSKPRF
jgi:hypothetical protein